MSTPSSSLYAVRRTPLKSGAAAIQILRAPRSFSSQATLLPPGAAISSEGNGAERTCSSVKLAAGARVAAAVAASNRAGMRLMENQSTTGKRGDAFDINPHAGAD